MTPGPTAVLLATAPGEGGDPAAALRFEGETLAGRLVAQLRALGVDEVCVIARRPIAGVEVRVSPDAAQDLRIVAELGRAAGDRGLLVAQGDVVTQHQALASLLLDPRVLTGALDSADGPGRPFAFGLRAVRGRIVSSGSPYHAVGRADSRFLGVLKVGPADVAALAAAADQLAALVAGAALPEGWAADLERKAILWREAGATETEVARRVAAAREDVTALLVVGLVRAGVHVGDIPLRELFWARPLSAAEAERAEAEIGGYDEDRVVLDSAVKATDGFFTTFFVSPYSKYVARWAAHRGLTPNQVTTVSLLLGVVAAAAFATGHRWGLIAGAVLLQVAFTTDCVDGQLARYTHTFTSLGAWLDSIFDRAKEYLVFAGLGIGAAAAGSPVWALAGATLTLQTVRHAFDFSFATAQHQALGAARQPPLEQSGDGIVAGAGRRARDAETVDLETRAAAPAAPGTSLPARLLALWRATERWSGAIWIKRMLAFPIGERFAVISLTAALFTPRTTFVVLLAWGGVGMVYGLAGRGLRALAR